MSEVPKLDIDLKTLPIKIGDKVKILPTEDIYDNKRKYNFQMLAESRYEEYSKYELTVMHISNSRVSPNANIAALQVSVNNPINEKTTFYYPLEIEAVNKYSVELI